MRDASARMWASRWRVRWGGIYGRLTIRDQVPLFLRQANMYFVRISLRVEGCYLLHPAPPPSTAPGFAEGGQKAPHRASRPLRRWTAWRSAIRTAKQSESLAAGALGVRNTVSI